MDRQELTLARRKFKWVEMGLFITSQPSSFFKMFVLLEAKMKSITDKTSEKGAKTQKLASFND